MPIRVSVDGKIVEFPDGTSVETIQSALSEQFKSPERRIREMPVLSRDAADALPGAQQPTNALGLDSPPTLQDRVRAGGVSGSMMALSPRAARRVNAEVAKSDKARADTQKQREKLEEQAGLRVTPTGIGGEVGARLARGFSSYAQGLNQALAPVADAVGLSSLGEGLRANADYWDATAGQAITGETNFGDVLAAPTLGNIASATAGGLIESIPSMVNIASGIGLGAEAVSRSGAAADTRAKNDGRSNATLGDVAVAAPFGIASAALDRFGLDRVVAGGIGKAALAEGLTEGAQGLIEYSGGSVGTKKGFDISEAGRQTIENAIGGALIGGTMHAGIDIGERALDARGRIAARAPADTRVPAPGSIEQALTTAATVTPEDEASPLPTQDIVEGRMAVASATATKEANTGLAANGAPPVGTSVTVAGLPGGASLNGTVADHFTDDSGSGVVIQPADGGKPMREYFDTLDELGVTITPRDYTAEADAIDAGLAAAPEAAADTQAPATPPQHIAERGKPVDNAKAIVEDAYPGVRVTSWTRPRDGAGAPASWHKRSRAAVDVAPIKGMTFEQFVDGLKARGYSILEAIDEVNHPSQWATGPHWHVVLGEGGKAPADAESAPAGPAAEETTSPSVMNAPAPDLRQTQPGNAVQPDMFGGPDMTEAQIAARDGLPKIVKEAQAEDEGVDLAAAHKELVRAFEAMRADKASPQDLRHYADTDVTGSVLYHAAMSNPEIVPALGASIGANSQMAAPQKTATQVPETAPASKPDQEPARPQDSASRPAEAAPAAPVPPASAAKPAAGMQNRAARVEDTATGKSVAVIGASEAELKAIGEAVPKAMGVPRKDGAIVYSKKYADKIKAALAGAQPQDAASTPPEDTRPLSQRDPKAYLAQANSELPQGYRIAETSSGLELRGPDGSNLAGKMLAPPNTSGDVLERVAASAKKAAIEADRRRKMGAKPPSPTPSAEAQQPAPPKVERRPTDKKNLNPYVRVGERYQVTRDIPGEYVGAGETYVMERVDPKSAYFRREGADSGTPIRNYAIQRALADGSLVKLEAAQSEPAPPPPSAPSRTPPAESEGAKAPSAAPQEKPADYGANNKLVTREQADEIRRKLREKLNPGRLNSGVDPEILALGTQLAVFHIEAGARRFADFARAVADDLGMNLADLRMNLRGWYNGARDTMEDMGESVVGMDGPDEVAKAMRTFDQWANQPAVTEGENAATGTVDAELSNRVPASDAGTSPEDVQRTSAVGSDGGASGREGGRGAATVQPSDRGRANPAERGTGRQADGARGDRTGVRDADRVPAPERDTRSARDAAAAVKGEDWTIEPGSLDEARSPSQKARDNVDAIALVKQIEAEGRPATRAEQAVIAKYVGWGGLKNIFPDPVTGEYGKGFETLGPRLRDLLNDEEYETARRSIQYAHYTAEGVVRPMWDIARQLGFTGGMVFEPGMGTGNFRGMMPADLAAASQYGGIEYDHLTASIAKLLYPQSGVRQADYTTMPGLKEMADLVIGNPPFSETVVSADPEYAKHKFVLHDFFFAKSMDAVKPGGLLMFVTSAGTMNKVSEKARQFLFNQADLVGAIRLPGDAFKENAGTQVTTDIIILRKRMAGEKPGDQSWLSVEPVSLPDRDGNMIEGNVNRYFVQHPDMVLGEQGMSDKLVAGPRYAVRAPKGFNVEQAIRKAAESLPGAVASTTPPAMPKGFLTPDIDLGSGETKEGSYYIGPDGRLMQFRRGAGTPVQARGKGVEGGMTAAAQERVRALVPIKDALRDVYAADIKADTEAGAAAREKLNAAYDAFVAKFGPINKTDVSYRRPSRVEMEGLRAEAREEARLAGAEWDDGSFDIEPYLQDGAKLSDIAAARQTAREEAIAAGRRWSEGTFDPEEVPDKAIEKRPNLEPFMEDDEAYRLAAIEHYNKETGEAPKGDVFFRNAITLETAPTIKSANDALLYSLNRLGRPDIRTIAEMAGKSENAVLEELGDRLFEVPGKPGTYETGEMYLSGNVREKLDTARREAEKNPAFVRNVRALEAAQPVPLTPSEITANLGMPWIPSDVVEGFGKDHMGLNAIKVTYLPKLAQWTVTGDTYSAAARSTWGTARMDATKILEAALNRQSIVIRDRIETAQGEKTVVNEADTQAAQDKLSEMKQAFRDWMWTDDARAARLVDLYNRNYNSLVAPKYDGSYLTTPGIASGWEWRPHQRAVIARIIQSGNTYMAHEVGAGKTSAMIGAGMEMKRLGLVNKPMYVVPNHMLGQFTKEFYEQYPLARILVADETRFHTSRRKEFIARMAAENWDAIIITHSAFGFIPMSDEFNASMISTQIDEMKDLLAEIGKGQDVRVTRRKVEQQIEAMEQRLRGLTGRKRDQVFTFEQTGVDFLFVDEAHLFRKLDFATKMGDVKGIDPKGSNMSFDLFAKTRYLEEVRPARNLVLASGTPITNTMAELFSVSRYLQSAELEKRGLGHFDAWAGAFGDTATALEQDAAGGYKPVTRFSKFVNVPELSVMVRQVMDVVGAAELRRYVSLPKLKDGSRQLIAVEATPNQEAYKGALQARMEAIKARSGPPKKGDDILLSVIGDGRKAAIDYRLIDASAPREPGSKLERMIEEVARRHKAFTKTAFHRPLPGGEGFSEKPVTHGPATQMIFSDFGINGDFPVHKYIRNSLIARGIPSSQIALISDYKTAVAKQRLFNDMNEGKVRVLIGSVAKMGTGVNAQRRLRALHNMDAQWFPANDTQRNGRIIRQGNMNPEVEILDYATNGTYDSTMWSMMGRKAGFIEGFMRGDPTMRDMEDLGEASQYEQAAAMITSDPRIMDLTEWKQDLEKIERRRTAFEREQQRIRVRIANAENDIATADRLVPYIKQDIATRSLPEGDDFTASLDGKDYDDRAEYGAALMASADALAESANGRSARETIGTFGGFPLAVETRPGIDGPVSSLVFLRAGKRETSVDIGTDSRGLVVRMANALRKFDSELAYQQSYKASAEREIADFRPQLGRIFDDGGKAAELRGKIKALEDKLKAETEAIEKAKAEARQPQQSIPEGRERLGTIAPEPVATLTGEELGKAPNGPGRMTFLRSLADRWLRKNMMDGSTLRTSDGRTVRINTRGVREVLRGGEDILRAVPALPAILEKGTLIERRDGDGKGTRNMWIYAANVVLDGRTMALGAMVRETANGDFQYSINKMMAGGPEATAEAAGGAEKSSIQAELEAGDGSGINLFPVDAADNPSTAADMAGVEDRLREQLADLRLADKVKLKIVETLGGAAGTYHNGIVSVALDTPQGAAFTVNHEAIHALRGMGLFKPEEWAILAAAARRDPGLMRSIRQRYAKLSADAQIEEAVADLFARHQDGRYAASGTVDRVFKMLRQVMEAVRNAFAGRGLRTAEGVMRDVARGEIGARGGQASLDGLARESRDGIDLSPAAREERAIALGFVSESAWQEMKNAGLQRGGVDRETAQGQEQRGIAGDTERGSLARSANSGPGRPAGSDRNRLAQFYHGTKGSIEPGFDLNHPERKDNGWLGRAVYVTDDPMLANAYADKKRGGDGANVLPLAINISNPFYATTREKQSLRYRSQAGVDAWTNNLRALGHDSVILTYPDGTAEIAVFDPASVRSIFAAFDPARASENDLKASIPERDDMVAAADDRGPNWRERMGDAIDLWRTRMQDRYLPLLRVQRQIERQTGASLPPSRNPYLAEELMTGRIGARLERLADDHVEPLFAAMHADKVSVEELESYLYARHAPERNARMQEINPELGPGEGSGMTDLEAAAIMSRIRKAGKMEAMERLGARVDRIIRDALDYRVETGLMSKAEAEEWRAAYKHYVPLRGFKETGSDPIPERINRSGGGINVRGRESRAAYGRRSKADSPLAYIIMQAEEAIVRGETNRVAQRFVDLAKANPDPEFWQVNKVTHKRRMNEDSGLVETYATHNLLAEDKDWTVSAKFDGKEVRVTMNRQNAAARRLADAMRNLTQHQLDFVTVYLGKVNRFLSAVNTSFNPEFIITNAFRDVQTATVNLSGEGMKGIVRKTLLDYRAALVASTKGAFGAHSGEWGKWYEEFTLAGGQVSFNRVDDIEGIKRRLQQAAKTAEMKAGDGGGLVQAKRALLAMRDIVENVNSGVENAIRLATYKNAREAGMGREQAASLAKNLTVNFNRRGTFGPAINAAYLFANASIQGNARMLMALKSRKVRRMLAAVMIAGALMELLNAMVSGVDDDGEAFYDKIPAYEKSRNFVIMLPDGRNYIKFPMPYGYNLFSGAGRTAAEIARRGGDRWQESAGNFVSDVADAFNPVGGTNSLLNFFAPSILDPVVDLAQNRNFMGRKIMPDHNAYGPDVPDSQRYWGSGSPIWKPITDFLNSATGGDKIVPGTIDISPEVPEYLSGVVIGSAGAFVQRSMDAVMKGFNPDEDLTADDIPMVHKLVGGKPGWYDKAVYYDRIAQVEQELSYVRNYAQEGQRDKAQARVEANRAVLSLMPAMKASKAQMRRIKASRDAIEIAHDRDEIDDATYSADKARLTDAEAQVIGAFNARWNAAMDAAP